MPNKAYHMIMYQRFVDFIQTNQLFSRHDRILAAVSGGVDSVVMMHLLLQAGYQTGIAHCNFQLRGKESDEEQQFVRQLAAYHKLPFYSRNFDTQNYASENKLSIQIAARQLRYGWLNELRGQYHYHVIALGHNKDDLAETFFINITRGTGLKGITGIKARNDHIVRPLLFADRKEIYQFSREFDLDFREDSSNLTDKYLRNRIRHHILPEFQRYNPRFLDTLWENTERFREAYAFYEQAIEQKKSELLFTQGYDAYIDVDKLSRTDEKRTVLFEILRHYNFSRETILEIVANLDAEPGKIYYTSSHRLIIDRKYLIVTDKQLEDSRRYYIDESTRRIDEPLSLGFKFIESAIHYHIPKDPAIAAVDCEKVKFPLILRKWQDGDYFKPFGFDHHKKLSDYFTDRKYSLLDKERTWVLASAEKIVWIVGDRPDDRFKIDQDTAHILEITLLRQPS